MYYKCSDCRPPTRACQYFGHLNEETCELQRGLTVMDKPVCSQTACTNNEFLIPSHSLYQRFLDENMNNLFVFFTEPRETDHFFKDFPAKDCLENDDVWCNFLSTRCWHLSKQNCNDPCFFDVVLFHDPAASMRYYYVSGTLPVCSYKAWFIPICIISLQFTRIFWKVEINSSLFFPWRNWCLPCELKLYPGYHSLTLWCTSVIYYILGTKSP